jgi:hypothetical protein
MDICSSSLYKAPDHCFSLAFESGWCLILCFLCDKDFYDTIYWVHHAQKPLLLFSLCGMFGFRCNPLLLFSLQVEDLVRFSVPVLYFAGGFVILEIGSTSLVDSWIRLVVFFVSFSLPWLVVFEGGVNVLA